MKFFFLATIYPQVESIFSEIIKKENVSSYAEMKHIYDDMFFSYFESGLCDELNNKKVEAGYIVFNSETLQRQWAEENVNNGSQLSLTEIVCEQIRKFSPDVLFFNAVDADLLFRLKNKFPKIRLWAGWVGSAIANNNQWKDLDLIFSCAPESVEILKNMGLNAVHMNHAFNPKILNRIGKNDKKVSPGITFVGSVMRGEGMHNKREQLLKALCNKTELAIYSSQEPLKIENVVKTFVKKCIHYTSLPFIKSGLLETYKQKKIVDKILSWGNIPFFPFDPVLSRKFRPGIFGVNMFETLSHSEIVLNVHADSSPVYASNMRLFETTGVGACLLTDYRANLDELFRIDTEVVTYSSVEDCVEKARWLIDHPKKRAEIAAAGQARCLKEHTHSNRVENFLNTINNAV